MPKLTTPQKFLLILFLGIIFLYSFNQLKEPDAFYHLKTGQVIWESKTIPHYDIFSYTAFGAPWIAHEWLAEVIFYLVYNFSGFWGLMSFVAILAALTYYLIFRLSIKKGANFYLTVVCLFALSYLTFKFWIPRPQIFAYLAFVILISLLESYRQEPKMKYFYFIVFDIWFWANINASFILGLVILIFYFVAEIIKKYIPRFSNSILNRKALINLGLIAGAALLISFVNPNTYKIFFYSQYTRSTSQILQILEWKSIISFWSEPQIMIFLVQMFFVDAFLIWWFFFRKQTRDLIWPGLILGISILPFIALRHYAFWPLAVIAPFSVSASGVLKEVLNKFSSRQLLFSLFSVGFVLLAARYFSFPRAALNEYILPVQAADFIEANRLQGPFFNLYNEGGYLIWRFWPKEKVFIDGRSEVFGKPQLKELFTIVGSLPGWEKLVNEKYHLNYFILSYWPKSLSESIQPLILALAKNNWPLVYWDDAAIIFVRNDKENLPLIEKYGLRYIHPFRDPSTLPAGEEKLAAEEIKNLLERSPNSIIVQNYAKLFLTNH